METTRKNHLNSLVVRFIAKAAIKASDRKKEKHHGNFLHLKSNVIKERKDKRKKHNSKFANQVIAIIGAKKAIARWSKMHNIAKSKNLYRMRAIKNHGYNSKRSGSEIEDDWLQEDQFFDAKSLTLWSHNKSFRKVKNV